jgi:hypothetical protein
MPRKKKVGRPRKKRPVGRPKKKTTKYKKPGRPRGSYKKRALKKPRGRPSKAPATKYITAHFHVKDLYVKITVKVNSKLHNIHEKANKSYEDPVYYMRKVLDIVEKNKYKITSITRFTLHYVE